MHHILVIDDEQMQLAAHQLFLREKGCVVEVVPSVQQALILLKKISFDLILLDVRKPRNGGAEACGTLRAATHVPIVLVSDYTEEDDQLCGFSAGAADYISKECGLELFWAKLTARLREHKAASIMRSFPPLIMDLQRQRVFLGQKVLQLTQTEFSLLALLSSHPGKIWSVESIYRELWGLDGPVNVTMVQIHLSRMRRKMEEVFPQHEFVVTVWGKGYQFVVMETPI